MIVFPDPNVETEYKDPNGAVWDFNGTGWVRRCCEEDPVLPPADPIMDIQIIGGGGGARSTKPNSYSYGGGGAGALKEYFDVDASVGSKWVFVIGAGGNDGTGGTTTLDCAATGFSESCTGGARSTSSATEGSGGGGRGAGSGGNGGSGGPYGNNGGKGGVNASGGGGGFGSVGEDVTASGRGANGGNGYVCFDAASRAGGGGGAGASSSGSGQAGGGNGGPYEGNGYNAVDNSGSGGGGVQPSGAVAGTPGIGGSGVILIRTGLAVVSTTADIRTTDTPEGDGRFIHMLKTSGEVVFQ